MTYSVDNLIVPADYNGFINDNTNYFNRVFSTGSGNWGYGQTALTTVAQGDLVKATEWSKLVNGIANVASHQGTSITSLGTIATGDLVKIINAVDDDIKAIGDNRLNAAAAGGTATSQGAAGQWKQYCVFTASISWSSADAARYFFNAGGQIGVSAYHPGGGVINDLFSSICSNLGTVWISGESQKLFGTNFTPNMKVGGGSGPWDSSNTGMGYNNISGGDTKILHQTTSASATMNHYYHGWTSYDYQSGSYADLYIRGGGGSMVVTLVLDEAPDGFWMNAGSTMYITTRSPSNSYLTESPWGSPSVSVNVSAA